MAEQTHNTDMSDETDRQDLEDRVDQLESTISKMLPSRRDTLKLGGAALVGGAAMSGSASAGTQQAGTIGTATEPVDVESEDINNADTVTTQDLVVNGTATGVGQDLQACRVFLSADQDISGGLGNNKVEFDSVVYDSGNNFDTTNHNFTCPITGLYFANLHIFFIGGAGDEKRRVSIGNDSDSQPNGKGSFVEKGNAEKFDVMKSITINKYAQNDTIAGYAQNVAGSDILLSGDTATNCFMEIGFLGSL